jgi:SAM-dependent methyltransferase
MPGDTENGGHGVLHTPESNIQSWVDRVARLLEPELAKLPPEGLILDICCAEGGVCRGLLPQGNIVGVEYSLERCRRAKGRILPVRGDACRLPVRSSSAAAVLFFEGIEHLTDPDGALKEIRRVLQPEGVLFISTPNTLLISLRRLKDYGAFYPKHIRQSHLREWGFGFPRYLERQGFRVIRKTSPDPLGSGMLKRLGLVFPEPVRWLMGCSQLLVARPGSMDEN